MRVALVADRIAEDLPDFLFQGVAVTAGAKLQFGLHVVVEVSNQELSHDPMVSIVAGPQIELTEGASSPGEEKTGKIRGSESRGEGGATWGDRRILRDGPVPDGFAAGSLGGIAVWTSSSGRVSLRARRHTMNILLWVLQVLAALLYGASGVMKVFMFDKVSKDVPSFGALPREAWMALGILELRFSSSRRRA